MIDVVACQIVYVVEAGAHAVVNSGNLFFLEQDFRELRELTECLQS